MEQYSVNGTKAETGYEFLAKTYGWMFLALVVSAACAYLAAYYEPLRSIIFGPKYVFYGLIIAEFALVIGLSAAIKTLPLSLATLFFLLYAAINGLTLASIFFIYQTKSIYLAFFSTALMFGLMSVYGVTTKKNLATAGHYLMMALIGLVIVTVVNRLITFFTHTPLTWLDWLLSVASVIIFTGLTAYDAQKIAMIGSHNDGSDAYKKISIYGALQLYLDFINIFLSLLRLFGKKR